MHQNSSDIIYEISLDPKSMPFSKWSDCYKITFSKRQIKPKMPLQILGNYKRLTLQKIHFDLSSFASSGFKNVCNFYLPEIFCEKAFTAFWFSCLLLGLVWHFDLFFLGRIKPTPPRNFHTIPHRSGRI